jgi:hypothetical protein
MTHSLNTIEAAFTAMPTRLSMCPHEIVGVPIGGHRLACTPHSARVTGDHVDSGPRHTAA